MAEPMPQLYEETEEMRANPRYYGPCARCGMPLIIPEDQIWSFQNSHPWESMCLYLLQEYVRERARRRGEQR